MQFYILNSGDCYIFCRTDASTYVDLNIAADTVNITGAGGLTVTGDILPATSGTSDLGSASLPFKDLYVEGGTIHVGTDTVIKDGQIGIGDDNPDKSLVVIGDAAIRNTSHTILTLDSTDGAGDTVIDLYQSGSSVAAIGYDQSSSQLKFSADGGLGKTYQILEIGGNGMLYTDTGNTLFYLNELSTGDPSIAYQLAGVTKATHGIDNSDSDKWKLSVGGTFSAHTVVSIDPSTKDTTFTQGDVNITNNLVLNGDLDSDLIPSASGTYDLGSASYPYAEIHGNDVYVGGKFLTPSGTAPTSASGIGTQGEIRWTDDHIYICVATNTWKRAALTSW